MNTEDLLTLHQETSAKCLAIMRRKNSDYTGGQGVDDPFANFNMASAFGIHPALGVVLRIGDKLQRIRSFANDGALQVTGETIDDACEDIVNYAIILKAMFRAQAAQYSSSVLADNDEWSEPHSAYAASLEAPWFGPDTPEDHEPDHYGHGVATTECPPPPYRLLEEGEAIREGDEVSVDGSPWLRSYSKGYYSRATHYPHRRLEHV